MTDLRYERAKALYLTASDLDDAARPAFLDRECAGDDVLRREVETLLNALAPEQLKPGGALEIAGVSYCGLDENLVAETTVGNYRLLERIGEGTFGEVWVAEHENPVRPRVAIKILKAGMDTREILARFQAERRVLAKMHHPNVASVLDAGATPRGRPYFVMEYVPGVPITEYCDAAQLSIAKRLDLFVEVCRGIQHAHQRGIIHRDLKPHNILVTVHGGRATPKVIDFGVAKATFGDEDDGAIKTEAGREIGTLEYMSPEQTGKVESDTDVRTDVYSLGVVLYELLTGTLPFDFRPIRRIGFDKAAQIICESEPPTPSIRLSTMANMAGNRSINAEPEAISRARSCSLSALIKSLKGDLSWIAAKALEKDRMRRYESVAAFAEDVRRYMSGDPVVAAPPSVLYRTRKAARKHKALIVTATLIVLVVTGGIIGVGVASRRADQEALKAIRAEQQTERLQAVVESKRLITRIILNMLEGASPSVALGRDTTVLQDVLSGLVTRLKNGELRELPDDELRLRLAIGDIYREIGAFALAHEVLDSTLDIAASVHGTTSPAYADSLAVRARLFSAEGAAVRALEEGLAALSIRLGEGNDDRVDVAKNRDEVGLYFSAVGRWSEALEHHQAALAMRRRLFPEDHLDVAQSLSNTGNCLRGMWKFERALPLQEEALAMYYRLPADQSLNIALALNNVSIVLGELGRTPEALTKQQEALDTFRRVFRGDHQFVHRGLSNLGGCLQDLNRGEEALQRFEEALAMVQRMYEGDNYEVANSLNDIGSCLESLGRSHEALPRYEAALQMHLRMPHGDLTHTLRFTNNLAKCLHAVGQYDEAVARFDEALVIAERVLAANDPRVGRIHSNMGSCLLTMKRYADAQRHLVEAQAVLDRSDSPPPNFVRENLLGLITLFDAIQETSASAKAAEQAAQWRNRLAAFDGASSLTNPQDVDASGS